MTERKDVQFIKGNDAQQDEFVDFINYVFDMNGHDSDFYRLLPKLYKKEYHPCEYNYLAVEQGRIKAAVGSFPGEVTVCGKKLKYQGIGNVAVNPYCRSRGYMKELMKLALEDMIKEEVDFSALGGRRQRYSYFSYEVVGKRYSFWMDESNVKHFFKNDEKVRFNFILLEETNKQLLQAIFNSRNNEPIYYDREEDKLFDILKSWKTVDIYGVYQGDTYVGYLLCYDKNKVKEIVLENQEDIIFVISDFLTTVVKGELTIVIPEYQQYFVNQLFSLAENVAINDRANFSVFNYGRVIEAFLGLKAQSANLADGEVVLLIDGWKQKESLLISVKENMVQVCSTEQKEDYRYNHQEAMSVLFGNYAPLRNQLPIEVQTWLPLPLTILPADEV